MRFSGDRTKSIGLKSQGQQFYNFLYSNALAEGVSRKSATKILDDGTVISARVTKLAGFNNWSGSVSIFTKPSGVVVENNDIELIVSSGTQAWKVNRDTGALEAWTKGLGLSSSYTNFKDRALSFSANTGRIYINDTFYLVPSYSGKVIGHAAATSKTTGYYSLWRNTAPNDKELEIFSFIVNDDTGFLDSTLIYSDTGWSEQYNPGTFLFSENAGDGLSFYYTASDGSIPFQDTSEIWKISLSSLTKELIQSWGPAQAAIGELYPIPEGIAFTYRSASFDTRETSQVTDYYYYNSNNGIGLYQNILWEMIANSDSIELGSVPHSPYIYDVRPYREFYSSFVDDPAPGFPISIKHTLDYYKCSVNSISTYSRLVQDFTEGSSQSLPLTPGIADFQGGVLVNDVNNFGNEAIYTDKFYAIKVDIGLNSKIQVFRKDNSFVDSTVLHQISYAGVGTLSFALYSKNL